jgi:hypothetical protein
MERRRILWSSSHILLFLSINASKSASTESCRPGGNAPYYLTCPTSVHAATQGEASAAILGAVRQRHDHPREATELAKLLASHMAALEVSERYETSAEMFPALNTLLGRSIRTVEDKQFSTPAL